MSELLRSHQLHSRSNVAVTLRRLARPGLQDTKCNHFSFPTGCLARNRAKPRPVDARENAIREVTIAAVSGHTTRGSAWQLLSGKGI